MCILFLSGVCPVCASRVSLSDKCIIVCHYCSCLFLCVFISMCESLFKCLCVLSSRMLSSVCITLPCPTSTYYPTLPYIPILCPILPSPPLPTLLCPILPSSTLPSTTLPYTTPSTLFYDSPMRHEWSWFATSYL